MTRYKVLIVGDTEVGKSTLAGILCKGLNIEKHKATIGVEVHPVRIGKDIYNLWDCKYNWYHGLKNSYYTKADITLVFFDWSRVKTLERVKGYINDVKKESPKSRIILVGNKYDIIAFKNKLEWTKRYSLFNISCLNEMGVNELINAIRV